MLSKLEAIYLRVLRVVILIAATAALFVAGLSIITVTPFFIDQIGFSDDLDGGDLASFIQEARVNEGISEVDEYGGDGDISQIISTKLQRSAKQFTEYVNKHHEVDYKQSNIEELMVDWQNQYPIEHHEEYEESLEKLTLQLQKSTGKPLTLEQLDQLFSWHNTNFQTQLDQLESDKNEEFLSAVKAFGIAGGAFLIFIFLVFSFLFVKIERNLRLLHFVNANPEYEDNQEVV